MKNLKLSLKKYHKILGFILLLPFITWAITGIFFFIKPGYSQAYEKLVVTTYPLTSSLTYPINKVHEVRILRSILGEHLLIKDATTSWRQINPITFEVVEKPSNEQVELLVSDAIKHNTLRYGQVMKVDGSSVLTTTKIDISLNWQNMTLTQRGADTEFIGWMYDVHYLRWTGIKAIDNVLGIVGLMLVIILAFLGVFSSIKHTK